MTLKKMSNLNQRLAVGGIGTVLIVLIVILSHYPYFRPFFVLTISGIIAAALKEFYQIAKNKQFEPLELGGIVGSIAFVIATYLATQDPQLKVLPELILAFTLLGTFLHYFFKGTNPFVNIALTLFGISYLALPLSCCIGINYFFSPDNIQDGRWWLFYLFAVTKLTDTGAFFCGKNFGTKKLAPYISPKKTWEGAIGGLISALLASLLIFFVVKNFEHPPISLSLAQALLMGLLIGILAQLGDLAESLLKRDMGVKDSNQLPGLGGVLDIVDSLIFTAPLVYFFLKMQ